ncbi:MAG: DUF177 domain-containing protein [Bacilli bacterium]|nr:DUF177 domain-containing protein [Bacilli bacterium]
MLKVAKASITRGRAAEYSSDEDLSSYKVSYPLAGVKACHYDASLQRVGEYIQCSFFINSTITLIDSRDGVHFDKKWRVEETFDILDDEDGEGEGYIVHGNSIDLDELVIRVITSSLPIKNTRPNAKMPQASGAVEVMTEDEYIESTKAKDPYNPAFDALADLDLED